MENRVYCNRAILLFFLNPAATYNLQEVFFPKFRQYCIAFIDWFLSTKIKIWKPNQNSNKLIYIYQQTDTKVYVKRRKTPNSQNNIEGEEQSQKTNAIQLQDVLYGYSTQESME